MLSPGSVKHLNHGEHRACFSLCPPFSLRFILSRSLAIASALAILACGGTTIPTPQIEASDSAGIRITTIMSAPESLPVWSLEPEPRRVFTGTETGDETAFAFIGPVKFLTDGSLVIGDVASARLMIYDAQGTFVRFHARRGDGPGEMRRLESITVMAADTVATFDPGLRRLSFWHPDTGFLRSVNLADDGSLDSFPIDAAPWSHSRVIVQQLSTTPQGNVPPGSGVRRWPTRVQLVLRDSSGARLDTSPSFDGVYTGLTERGDIRLPFSNRPFVALARDRVYFGSGDAFELNWLDTSFRVAGILRWPANRERLTSGEVDGVRGEAIATISRRPLPPNPFAIYFAPEILPEFRPSIGRVLVDRENRIWIERFEAMRMGAAQKPGELWSILRDDGLPVAVLRLPPRTRLEDMRGDEVVVVRRDSLDVQTVAVYRLRR
jgi:hypothetical protein